VRFIGSLLRGRGELRVRGSIEVISNQVLQRIEPEGARWYMDIG
jgi:hypothetical protein